MKHQKLIYLGVLSSLVGFTSLLACSDKVSVCQETQTCPPPTGGTAGDGDETGGNGGSMSDGSGGGETTEACGECAAPTPACNDAEECVECTSDTHCEGATPLCDVSAEECVGCLGNVDCTDADASVCDGGSCSACVEDADCSHVTGKGICDAGACVECKDRLDCSGNVCEKATQSCLQRTAGEAEVCGECEYDDDCQVGQLCVEQEFGGQVVGNFCMWRQDGRAGTAAGSCIDDGKPYAGFLPMATSVEGTVADVCTLATTSCPAFLQHRQVIAGCEVPMDDDGACGVSGMMDGVCRFPGGSTTARCTYACGSDEDCKVGFTCTGDNYCSL